ncbi:acyloxyacyl hydrolase [Desulfosediminicola sp.]|uniref:acyloxyacyl hydrolase n=1 Tax=Desulfosediminicola sp. TaxID=2886825 RepID=UPI003AF21E88
MRKIIIIFLATLASILSGPGVKQVKAFDLASPERVGIAMTAGASYHPAPTFEFVQLSGLALYDYKQIFPHQAPDQLKFKLETNIGAADFSGLRLMASLNFYAVYYLEKFQTNKLRPYIEGGAGIIYSDFQVEDQGLRINFNPQAGIGVEISGDDGRTFFGALHATHISNGGLHSDNAGINGLLFQFGYLF